MEGKAEGESERFCMYALEGSVATSGAALSWAVDNLEVSLPSFNFYLFLFRNTVSLPQCACVLIFDFPLNHRWRHHPLNYVRKRAKYLTGDRALIKLIFLRVCAFFMFYHMQRWNVLCSSIFGSFCAVLARGR